MTQEAANSVSVVIPARNEELNIERVVRSVAAQEGVREIVVVDDQSADTTPEILRRLAGEFPKLRVLRVEALPDGWLGKNWALATGARATSGEWLLFTDADTEHRKGSLATLLARAKTEGAALLSLSPGQRLERWWERALIPLVYTRLARLFRFEEVSNPDSPAAAANGQYILIRREAYEPAGGHEAVRAEILEDVALARRVKASGGRILFLPGAEWVETHMYRSLREMLQGWSKNLFLLYGRSAGRTLAAAAETAAFDVALPLAFFLSCVAFILGQGRGAVGLAMVALLLVVMWRQWSYSSALERLGFEARLANYQVPGGSLFVLCLLNSLRIHSLGGRVEWKGRAYSTKEQGKGTS